MDSKVLNRACTVACPSVGASTSFSSPPSLMTPYMQPGFGTGVETASFSNLGYQGTENQGLWNFDGTGNGANAIPRSQATFGMLGMQVSRLFFKFSHHANYVYMIEHRHYGKHRHRCPRGTLRTQCVLHGPQETCFGSGNRDQWTQRHDREPGPGSRELRQGNRRAEGTVRDS